MSTCRCGLPSSRTSTVYAGLYGVANAAERIAYIAEDLQISRCSTARPASCQPARRHAWASPKPCSMRPSCSLLDEPTASLDPDTADWIRRKLKQYADTRGATLLLASHNMAEVERLADRVILLHEGRIIEDGTPAGLIETYGRETLEDVFPRCRARPRKA